MSFSSPNWKKKSKLIHCGNKPAKPFHSIMKCTIPLAYRLMLNAALKNDLSVSPDSFFHNKERVRDQAGFQPDSIALSVNEHINTSLASAGQAPSDWREVYASQGDMILGSDDGNGSGRVEHH